MSQILGYPLRDWYNLFCLLLILNLFLESKIIMIDWVYKNYINHTNKMEIAERKKFDLLIANHCLSRVNWKAEDDQ